MTIRRTISAVAAATLLAVPVAAAAQPVPSYASQEQQIHGTVASFDGKYDLYVHDDRGYVDTVHLHDGTVINPTGLTLAAGETVTILGRSDGSAFDANEIDTPYQNDDGYAIGPDAGYVSPYPYFSYYPAYALSYPAFISLGFGFGYGSGYYGGGYYGRGYYGHGYNGGGYGHGYYGRGYNGPGTYGHGGYNGAGTYGHTGYGGATTYGRGTYGGGSYGGRSYGGYSRGAGAGAAAGGARSTGGGLSRGASGGGSRGGGGGGGAHH